MLKQSTARVLGAIEVEDATAAGLYNGTKSLLNHHGIPMNNIIGLAVDNCSTMMGSKNGFQARMKQDIPGLFVMGCICHSIALCASHASKCLPSWLENLLSDIGTYFSRSAKRTRELQLIMDALSNPRHTILKLATTRWLSRAGRSSPVSWNSTRP